MRLVVSTARLNPFNHTMSNCSDIPLHNSTTIPVTVSLGAAAPTSLVLAMLTAVVLMACQVYLIIRVGSAIANSNFVSCGIKRAIYWPVFAFYLMFTGLSSTGSQI